VKPTPSTHSNKMSDAKTALQTELVAVKKRWSDQVKLVKAAKDAPAYPMPLAVVRSIPRPDKAHAYDVEEMPVRLWIDSLEAGEDGKPMVRADVGGVMPQALRGLIGEQILARWHTELEGRGAGNTFFLEKLLSWVEFSFIDLIKLEPACLEQYEGCDDEGRTIRRFMIVEPPPPPGSEEEEESEEDEEDDSEEEGPELSPEEERELVRQMELLDRKWREERRAEAAANKDNDTVKMSRKEQEAALAEKKARAGSRLRKTGARCKKFDAEAAGKQKNKKNGLIS